MKYQSQSKAFSNEKNIAFNRIKWQLSCRSIKVWKPGTRKDFVMAKAIWIDCLEAIVLEIRDAFRLICSDLNAMQAYSTPYSTLEPPLHPGV